MSKRDIGFIEGLCQYKQAQLACGLQQRFGIGARHHTQNDEHATGTGQSCFGYLIRINQKVFAHGRHATALCR